MTDPWSTASSFDPEPPPAPLPTARRYVPVLLLMVVALLLADCVGHWITRL